MIKKQYLVVFVIILAMVVSFCSCSKSGKSSAPSAGSEKDEMELLRKIGAENYTGYYLLTWDKPDKTAEAIQTVKTKLSDMCPTFKSTRAQNACKTYQEVIDRSEEKIPGVQEAYNRYIQTRDEWLQAEEDMKAAEAKLKLEAGKVNADETRRARTEVEDINKKRLETGKATGDYKKEFENQSCTGVGQDKNRPECPGYEFSTTITELLK